MQRPPVAPALPSRPLIATLAALLVAVLAVVTPGHRAGATPPPANDHSFTIVHFTDTQYYSEGFPSVYSDMTRWIAENAGRERIAYAMHTGDLVQNWIVPGTPEHIGRAEFQRARAAQDILDDAGIPNGVLPGNHDNFWNIAGQIGAHELNHRLYNEYFGPQHYADKPWWGDSWKPGDNAAHFDTIEVAGTRLLFLYLGYNAPVAVFDWAAHVIAAHPDHNVVIGTHFGLDADANRAPLTTDVTAGFGQLIWDRLVVPHANVFLVLSGHIHAQETIVSHNVGGSDRTVVEMLADYQDFRVDGKKASGFLRLLRLNPTAGTMNVRTYSPTLDRSDVESFDPKHRYGPQHGAFDVDLRLPVGRAIPAGR